VRIRYAIASLALVAAGCGGAKTAAVGAPHAKIAARSTKLGTIITDADGRTLYDFKKDKGTTSACYGACASVWPPVTTSGTAVAGPGVRSAELGVTKRKDGSTELTYAGHPLYTFAGDAKPGDTKGNDIDQFGAEWYALSPAGEEADG
jgi:predicted lipoprotein with Yx(FWY)xxD motif